MSDGMERISDGDLCLVAHNANPLDGQGGIDYLRVVRAVRAAIEGPLLADLARAHRALARAGYTDAGGVEWAAPEPAPIASSAREDIANLQAAQEATRAHNVGPFGEGEMSTCIKCHGILFEGEGRLGMCGFCWAGNGKGKHDALRDFHERVFLEVIMGFFLQGEEEKIVRRARLVALEAVNQYSAMTAERDAAIDAAMAVDS